MFYEKTTKGTIQRHCCFTKGKSTAKQGCTHERLLQNQSETDMKKKEVFNSLVVFYLNNERQPLVLLPFFFAKEQAAGFQNLNIKPKEGSKKKKKSY